MAPDTNAPSDEHILLNGKVMKSSVSWTDNNDGRVVYVGKQQPIITDDVVALIDPGLPESIKASLEEDIPNMMAFFSHSLNPLKGEKPMLFASYANVEITLHKADHSTQGGKHTKSKPGSEGVLMRATPTTLRQSP